MNLLQIAKIINFVSSIFCFLLAISILCEERICKIRKMVKLDFGMFLLTLTTGLWTANMGASLFFIHNKPVSEFFSRLNWIGGFVVSSFTYLTLLIAKQSKKAKIVGIIQFVIAAIFVFLAFTPIGIKNVISIFPLERESGPAELVFRLWIFVSVFYCIYLTVHNYLIVEGNEKLKLQYYSFGVLIFAILAVVFNSILPLFKIEKFIYFTSIGSVIWILSTFYSVHTYKLLDIEVIFCDAVRYSVFIFLGLILNYILFKVFSDMLYLSPLLSSTFTILVIGTIYFISPIKEKINVTIRNIVLRKRTLYQKLLEDTVEAVHTILDLDSLLDYVVKQIHTALGATKICFFLLDKETKDENGEYVYKLATSYGFERLKTTVFKQYKIIKWLKQHKEPLLLDVAYHTFDSSDYRELTESLHLFGAIIIIPIIYKDELIGIITLDQKKVDGTIFDIEDINILKTLADELAIAIENSKMYDELNAAYLQITRALSLALESKDNYLIGHSDNVTKYAVLLGKKIGLADREIYILAQAGMLHDLGKITIHDYVLNKPGKLTEKEWEEIKQHPIKGAKILEPLPFLDEVRNVILHHHEHYDGNGYPEGLKGEQIPLLARILTLADSVETMLSERPYKERAMTVEEMINEIVAQKGKHFDPVLVDKFIEIINEYPDLFIKNQKH